MNLMDATKKLQSEEQCLAFLEKTRWPDGKVRCLQCGNDKISRIARTVDETKTRRQKKQNKRKTLYECLEPTCRYQFSATTGTLFHDSHLPLYKWFAAMALIVHAKKGMSAKQMQRHLGVNYRTAWYMGHRIRKAMAQGKGVVVTPVPLAGTVEMDETYVGGKTIRHKDRGNRRYEDKDAVFGMRERGGDVRTVHLGKGSATAARVRPIIQENVSRDVERVITDESQIYPVAFDGFCASKHETIRHKDKIYVRGDVHTNTIESAFSLFKRGIVGSFHSISSKHMHRYLSEFDYRFNGRDLPDLFGATLANMVNTGAMKYSELTAE
jgi:transposase-like protein